VDGEIRADDWSLPGYRIGPVLGRGGFATVFQARQLSLDRDVAIKVLTTDLATDGDRRRFDRERQALARLSAHPHVVEVFDAGVTPERRPYLVMRLYPGGTLADRLAQCGQLSVDTSIDLVTKLASALDAAHANGMLHRDVKPQNVLLTEDGEPVLADFGIAGIIEPEHDNTPTSTTFFTLAHVAPEILERRRYSAAADVYALASTTYQLLTGRPAFDPDDPRVGTLVLDTPPPPITLPDVPAPVADAVLAAMAKNPADRPATAGAFANTLAALASTPPNDQAPAVTAPLRSEPFTTIALQPVSAQGVASRTGSLAPGGLFTATVPEAGAIHNDAGSQQARNAALARPSAPTRAPSWRVVLAAAVAMLVVISGIGYYLVNRRPTPDQAESGPARSSSQNPIGAAPEASPAGDSPADASPLGDSPLGDSPADMSSDGSTSALLPTAPPQTGPVSAPTCQQPGDLQRLEGVQASGKAKPDETFSETGYVSYAAENLVDGDTSTAWVEGSPDLGVGSRIHLTFPRSVKIQLSCIVNGYGKSWDTYQRNARVRDLEAISDKGTESTALADLGSTERPAIFQEFHVPPGKIDHLDLVVRSAYTAQQIDGKPSYDDTCISELEFWYAAE
jgi:serine/threonine protein kinase